MGAIELDTTALSGDAGARQYLADVLVLGGGPAGTWAAISAAARLGRGARVLLADKGYCGSSGATAPSGTGVWYVEPTTGARNDAKQSRATLGGHLADEGWMDRVLAQTYANVHQLAEWGYPFPLDENGAQRRGSLQGPEYMRLMRKRVKEAGVKILDHSPALELLVDHEGRVAGATGLHRQKNEAWVVRAGSVVIATGGCAFLSKALGTNVLTGDGHLMAAEAGAEFSGMEFSNAYGLGPAFSSVTKSLFYNWATFVYADGSAIPGAGSQRGRGVIARTLLEQPVYAIIDRADAATRAWMRGAQPNFFLPFDRAGIDPFTQKFPVTLRLEGTVRGTGGLRIRDANCATSVEGLYAAGDAATRELICGGFTGGGSHNAAWAMSSGFWAGAGAGDYSRSLGRALAQRPLLRAGGAALQDGGGAALDPAHTIAAVQREVLPYERNYFRRGAALEESLQSLDALWARLRGAAAAAPEHALRSREAAALTAVSRWMYRSALARTESRGMHKREDFQGQDGAQRHYLISGGLDHVWVKDAPGPAPLRAAPPPAALDAQGAGA
jgi:succinate dehydrogenase/fumarate reductase flavoprotein subunit